MSLQRKQIRKAIAERLKDKIEKIGPRVYPSRVRPVWETEELPCILVYSRSERNDQSTQAPPEWKRTVFMDVVILTTLKGETNVDDELDEIADWCERLIMAEDSLDNLVSEITLKEVETTLEGEGDEPIGSCTLNFEIIYFTQYPNPEDQRLENFLGGKLTFDQAPPNDDVVNVEGSFTVPGP